MKVCLATLENNLHANIIHENGIPNGLWSCFRLAMRRFKNNRITSRIKTPAIERIHLDTKIMDSGLFSLMFGKYRELCSGENDILRWYDAMIETIYEHDIKSTIVECDCQKITSPQFAWKLREKMRNDLPNHEIINVFHLEDGPAGFERLIEFSDYMAISVPELRIAYGKYHVEKMIPLGMKVISKNKKLHYLGFTSFQDIHKCRFATSCDSSSWTAVVRYPKTSWQFSLDHRLEGRDKLAVYACKWYDKAAFLGGSQPRRKNQKTKD